MSTVAIVTPIYATPENGRLALFRSTSLSVIQQRNPGLVYLVVDDGSTSNVERYLQSFNDPRIRYIRRERTSSDLRTASNALNLGIDYCLEKSGDVFTRSEAEELYAVAFLHSDDLLGRDSIEMRSGYLGNGFVHTDMGIFNNDGDVIGIQRWKGESDIARILAVGTHLQFNYHTVIWQLGFLQYLKDFAARKYEQAGVFDPLLSHGEDRDVSLSCAEAALEGGYDARHIPVVSVFYRRHEKSISGELVESQYHRTQQTRVFQKHFGKPEPRKLAELLGRLQADSPWSWGTFLPERTKRTLRPVRDHIKSLSRPREFTEFEAYLHECGVR